MTRQESQQVLAQVEYPRGNSDGSRFWVPFHMDSFIKLPFACLKMHLQNDMLGLPLVSCKTTHNGVTKAVTKDTLKKDTTISCAIKQLIVGQSLRTTPDHFGQTLIYLHSIKSPRKKPSERSHVGAPFYTSHSYVWSD